ncbi:MULTISPECIES: hypothetical protein [Microbulbifer]|uniref:hypothetical protein n=1 Tax=Microbulbifer TaxID=48073 RepID=UPI001E61219C|nr:MULTISPECIES: hypothetical protein [Microbulbifer]UHQ57054.1 hypothetical protein LVE68_08760 [Microbulbifer sp. YPW16]
MEALIRELIFTGNIVQDSDESVPWPERENRFNRYIELLDSIDGSEGLPVARALIQSMQSDDDYGAYQTTQAALGKFSSKEYIEALTLELPPMIKRGSEWAGELLCSLANSVGTQHEADIALFIRALNELPGEDKNTISRYIEQQEEGGWLAHRKGVLRGINA